MGAVSFFIPGPAKGKARPRVTRNGVFTPKTTANYESLIALAARTAMADAPVFDGPVSLHMRVWCLPPGSVSKKNRLAMALGDMKPLVKPDLDNVIKAVLDGCARIVFLDDKQITHIAAVKNYGDQEGVEVHLGEIGVGDMVGAYPWR